MISHIKLNEIKKLSESVTLKADDQGYEFIIIDHQNFDAAFTLHGGHLIHFQHKHQAPLIYLSNTAVLMIVKLLEAACLFVGLGLQSLKKN